MWRRLFGKAQPARPSRRAVLGGVATGGGLIATSTTHAASDPASDAELARLWASAQQQNGGVLSSRQALSEGEVPASIREVTLLGYHAPGDGGGGLYVRRRNRHTDPQSVQSADGATWTLVPRAGSISIRQFGAVGDGLADDTEAIRAACRFASLSQTVRTVTFPTGQYRVTGPLIALGPEDRRIAFRGQDAETTQILLDAPLARPLIEIEGAPYPDRTEWITFAELTFRNPARRYRGDCVRIRQAYHVDWIRCRFIGWNGHALYLDDYWDSNFDGCRVIGCGSPNERDATRARVPFDTPKPAIWIGSSSARVTSNNLTFTACQFESSWHTQMHLDDMVRRVTLLGCKFHGNQRAIITESQLWVGGAHACKATGCAFAYGQSCDHIEFAGGGRRYKPRGWTIVGCDFSYSDGAAIRIRDGSHLTISANNFGLIGVNRDSIVIEDSVPTGARFGQIAITANSLDARETAPRIAKPQVVVSETFGQQIIRAEGPLAQTVVMPEPPADGPHQVNRAVTAHLPGQRRVVVAQERVVAREMKDGAEAGALQFRVQQDGTLTPFLDIDGARGKVLSRQTLEIAGRWDGAHLQLGACHLWVDSAGTLRVKKGRPRSEEDGTPLG